MQFVLESQIYKSATTVDVDDDVDLILLNGEVFQRIFSEVDDALDKFVSLGSVYDYNAEQAKKPRREVKEDAPKLNGLPTFPAAPTGVAAAIAAATAVAKYREPKDSISRSTTQTFSSEDK